MYQLVSEAFIHVPRASCVAEQICGQIGKVCRSVKLDGSDKVLSFENGRAIIRPTVSGLILRVYARDVVTYYGIQTLIEGSLAKLVSHSIKSIAWIPAHQKPVILPSTHEST